MNFRKVLLAFTYAVVMNTVLCAKAEQEQAYNAYSSSVDIAGSLGQAARWYIKAQQALAERDYDKAIKALENSLWYNPENQKSWIQLYRSYRYLKQTKYALNSLVKALKYFPNDVYLLKEKVKIYDELDQYDNATRVIKRILTIETEDADVYIFLAHILYQQKKYDEALINTKKVEELGETSPLLYLLKGNIYAQRNLLDEAIKEYTTGIDSMATPSLYLQRAKAYYEYNKYEEAAEDLDNVLMMDPFNYEAWDYKGRILYADKQYHEALEAFNTSLAIDAKAYHEQQKIDNYLYYEQRYQEIVKLYDVLSKNDPDNPEIWNNQAEALLRLHLERKVINQLEQHHSLDNIDIETPETLQTKNILTQMETYAKNALKLNPDDPQSWFYQGFIYYYYLDFAKAAKAFEKSIELGFDKTDIYHYLSKAYEGMGMFSEAEEVFKTSLQIDSYNAQTWYQYAALLAKADKEKQALQALNKGIEVNRHLAFMWSLQGEIYLKLEEAEKALDSFEQALVYHPISKVYLEQLGRSYLALTFFDEAINVFNIVLKEDPAYVPAYVSKGKTYFEQKKYQQALDMFNKALELDQNNVDIMLEKARILLKKKEDINYTLSVVDNILKYDLANYETWSLKGIAHYMKEDYNQAQKALENCIDIINKENKITEPDSFYNTQLRREKGQATYYQSLIAFKFQDYEKASSLINTALEFQENNTSFLKQKINVLKKLDSNANRDQIASIASQINRLSFSKYIKQKNLRRTLSVKILSRNF